MRFPSQPGPIDGFDVQLADLKPTMPFWRSVLYPRELGCTK